MKRLSLGCVILLIAAMTPQSSNAQLLKNLVNNMKIGAPRPKPSIPPADSAAAIKSFTTGTGGIGQLYQYQVTYTFSIRKKDSVARDTMQIAITDSHDFRSDMGGIAGKMAVIGHGGMPLYSVSLYAENKTFRFNIIDTAAINTGDPATYQVTKVGSETIAGYPCIHSKLTLITGRSQTLVTEDIWTSTAVPGYTSLKKMMGLQNVTPKMLLALDQAGCGGFFVKMTMQSASFSMNMLLVTAARKNFDAALFTIPAGYTEAKNTMMFGPPKH